MIRIEKYNNTHIKEWNLFVASSKNATFLFDRNYMDYHSDRYHDYSFLFIKKNNIIALLPGNINEKTYYSHQGLTYGGLILSKKTTTKDVMLIFELLIKELKKESITDIIYKPIPYIYHKFPSQEDIYALFRYNAIKTACNISSCIQIQNKILFTESRKSGVRKAKTNNVTISKEYDLAAFWEVLTESLSSQHNTKAVHSIKEINKLRDNFPKKISLYVASIEKETIAGTIVFDMGDTIHIQYIAANNKGKELGALDFLFDYLINVEYKDVRFFDLGHSCLNNGKELNENLIFQKEGFGARGIAYETYQLTI